MLSAYPPAVWALFAGTSGLIGLPAGLLGVGGGIAAVPVLPDVLFARAPVEGLPGHLLPLIVGLLASAFGGGALSIPMLSLSSCPARCSTW